MLGKSLAVAFDTAGFIALFLTVQVNSKVAWSSIDVFDNLLSTKQERGSWYDLATAIQELKEWPRYFGPATHIITSGQSTVQARSWSELAEIAINAIEDVRVQLEPVDTDTVKRDYAANVLRSLNLGSVTNASAVLDDLDRDLAAVPEWLTGLAGFVSYVRGYNENPASVVFWLFGANLGSLTPGGEMLIIWETQHPYHIVDMLSRLQIELMEVSLDFQDGLRLIEALATGFGDKEWHTFQDMMAYCSFYTELTRRIATVIGAIMETKGFKELYDQSSMMYPVPQELEGFYEKYRGLPTEQSRTTLLDEVNAMTEVEIMRVDNMDLSSVWLDPFE
ncbi:hypothetical protein TWF730_007578 [Orbilia blumenaviensis]|uniref:Uncharacterized protein n=1 Tax=Orbilia blumenaviensis TaxID=1796055 RepID=A0AAV9V9D1_9PEZI